MSSSPDDQNEVTFSADDFKRLAKALRLPALPKRTADQIRLAALKYEFMSGSDQMRASKADRRKALKVIEKAAAKLTEALGAWNLMVVDNKPTLLEVTKQQLDRLIQAAKEAEDAIRQSGANPKLARYVFVRDLAEIYVEATGKRPALHRNIRGEPGGAFFRFVETALSRIDRPATQGLETDVRKIIAELRNSPPK